MNDYFDIELEKAVLAAILIDESIIHDVMTLLVPDSFYHDSHKLIYTACLELYNKSSKIDLLTVTKRLRDSGKLEDVGGVYYVSKITDSIGSSANVMHHARILSQLYITREMISVLQSKIYDIQNNRESDINDHYNELIGKLGNIFELKDNSEYFTIFDSMRTRLNQIEKIKPDEHDLIGIHTGFSKLNKLTNGLQPGDFIILAARPSMGKTIVSLISAKASVFLSGVNCVYFSLEMSKERICDRLLSLGTGLDSRDISANRLSQDDWQKIEEITLKYNDKQMFIIDNANLTIEQIRAKAISLHRKYGIGFIVIDYIQLIQWTFRKENGNMNVGHISKNIKSLAKEIGCPVLALSQMNRSGTGLPTLKELRDSGSLEQDSDIVWFLHRSDYEGKECEESERKEILNLIEKNRNGAIGAFKTYRNDYWSYIGEEIEQDYLSLINGDVMYFKHNG